jgi:hypothetical protein
MTTPSIQIASQTFAKRVGKAKIPYYSQCSGFYLFGGNDAQSVPNLISGQPALTKVGTPTYGSGYATVDVTKGFDTGLLLDSPYTQVVVANESVGGGGSVLNRPTGGESFIGMLRLRDSASFTIDVWPNGVQTGGFDNLQSANFRCCGAFWGGTGTSAGAFAFDPTGRSGLLTTFSSFPTSHTVTPTTSLRVGGGGSFGVGASVQVAAVALFPFMMTYPQIREVYAYLKALLASRGITTL